MPFYLTNFRNLSTSLTGLIMMAIPLANVIAAPIAGYFTDKYNATIVSLWNLLVYLIPLVFLIKISANVNLIIFTLMISLLGVGNGGFQNNPMIMGYAPQEYQGVAGSLTALFRNIGMGLGVSLATTSLYYGMSLKAHRTVNYYPKNNPDWFLSGMSFSYITALIILILAIVLVVIIRKIDKHQKSRI
jgi:MFS family permease